MKHLITTLLLATYFSLQMAQNSRQNFCQNDRCLTCIGRYCTTTCQGRTCKSCPLGDCCDGTDCNICRGERCCSTSDCNSCVNTCLKDCQGVATCHYDCFQKCLPSFTNGKNGSDAGGYQNSGRTLISNNNYLPVNVTTIINITNTIENENVIRHPILVNTTNINNYTGHRSNYHRKQIFVSQNNGNESITPDYNKQNCCEVVHPEKCRSVGEEEGTLCYTRKHKECSNLCTGKHVHIVEDKEEISKCISISEQPHWFCGQYAVENCDDCYNCANIDDLDCTQDANCSEKCRSSLIPEEFYNKLYRKD